MYPSLVHFHVGVQHSPFNLRDAFCMRTSFISPACLGCGEYATFPHSTTHTLMGIDRSVVRNKHPYNARQKVLQSPTVRTTGVAVPLPGLHALPIIPMVKEDALPLLLWLPPKENLQLQRLQQIISGKYFHPDEKEEETAERKVVLSRK